MPPTKYCGKKINLPAGYPRFGTRYECLQTGFGVATALCHQNPNARRTYAVVSWTLVLFLLVVIGIILSILVFVVIRLLPRKDGDHDEEKEEDMYT